MNKKNQPHKQVLCKVNTYVDEGIKDLVEMLNSFDKLCTCDSCQGGNGQFAIVYFEYGVDLDEVWNVIKEKGRGRQVYVSVDIDVFSPVIAPGVSYVEEGGFNEEEFFDLFGKIKEMDVRAYDLVEVVIDKDVDGKTVKLAKKIVEKINQ